MSGRPNVYFTPPGVDFSEALARGLRARLPADDPAAMARVRLYLNARRTGRAVSEALEHGRPAAFLPRIALVGELSEEALAAAIPQGRGRLRRTLALMRLTEAFLVGNPGLADPASAPALALSLRALLDELQAAGKGAEALRDLELDEHAAHWTLTAEFLSILADAWPEYLAEEEHGAPDREARRRLAVAALIARWEASPPTDPVIVAGSTGSTPATAELMRAAARLPSGALVLPGWDPAMAGDVWESLTAEEPRPEHPHHHMARLLNDLGLRPDDPAPWDETCPAPPAPARLRLLTRALRPAPVTDAWRRELPEQAAEAAEAVAGLTLLEAETPRDEAAAIAAALASEAAAGGTPALITPDRVLARRVAAELSRWGVAPDDSGGRPLGLTPPGILLGLTAGRLGRPMTAETLAALLRHPLTAKDRPSAPDQRGRQSRFVNKLERDGLRGGTMDVDWDRLEARLRARRDQPDDFLAWFGWVRAALTPLASPPADLPSAVALHRRVAEALAAGPAGLEVDEDAADLPLWAEAQGRDARAFLDGLEEAAPALGASPPPGGYGALWLALIQAEETRPDPARVHDRIRILGALEARAESASLMILGGLNEGVWPAHPTPDPWLNRQMRKTLGLASPERRIGLAAHDFLQAACAPRTVLSRALRDDGGPASPSRWLVRLENLLKGADKAALAAMRARGQALARGADGLDAGPRIDPAPRPAPPPPVALRPRGLSFTQVETLVRDPYAIYARHVLRLRKLDPIGRAPDARDMGTALHAVMEAFAEATRDWTGAEATPAALRAALMAAAERELPEAAPWPALRRLWSKRLARAADWIAQGEAARRAEGRVEALEVKGARLLEGPPGGAFELSGKADRVDRLLDGRLALYDYKTGSVPSAKQIGVFSVQLLLEAAVAEAGGFENVPGAPVAAAEYLGLSGAGAGGKASAVDFVKHPVADVWADLGALVARYDDAATGYLSRARMATVRFAGDYDQLARHGEWSESGEEGGE